MKHLMSDASSNKKVNKFSASSSGLKKENKLAPNSTSAISIATPNLIKQAQSGGSGNNAIMAQPMFFSPLHTAQNWQQPSRRREQMQWSFINPCYITSYEDFSLVNIREIVAGSKIQDGFGNLDIIDITTRRNVEKKANRIYITGTSEPLIITHDHNCRIIKREDIECPKSRWNNKLMVSGQLSEQPSSICKRSKCNNCKNNIDYLISTVKAEEVKKGDFVLIPFSKEIKESKIKTIDQARFAGHLASDGSVSRKYKSVRACMHEKEIEDVYPCVQSVFSEFDKTSSIERRDGSKVVETRCAKHNIFNFASSLVSGKGSEKKYTSEVMLLDPKLQLHVLGAYIQSDGHFNAKNKAVEITTCSKHLANQLLMMFYRCGILARVSKQKRSSSKKAYKSNNEFRYLVGIPSSESEKIKEYVPGKMKNSTFKKHTQNKRFFWNNFVVTSVSENERFDYKGEVYDIRAPKTNTVTANGVSIFQCRFFYSTEAKVAAGVDFTSLFPMNGFKLECKSKKILEFYEDKVEDLKLNYWSKMISFEYHLLGDVFPYINIKCDHCGNTGILPDGNVCNHPDGDIERILVLNPDWVEVTQSVLADEPQITLVPDEELRQIVSKKQPKHIYDSLPEGLVAIIASAKPIVLSNRSVSHLKHMNSPYSTYGTSILQRLFTVLSYKTKIMTANWIVAERLILPLRIVKVGNDARPASQDDLAEVANQLAAVANDPNLTLVTHHNLEVDWVGGTGKIHAVTQELDYIGKEILDGLMLNQAILNGEMSSYSGMATGIEVMIRRLESWRTTLKEWIEEHIFLPIAMMKGFIDEEATKRHNGKTKYLYPRIKWNDLNLRDRSNTRQALNQLHDKKLISGQTLLEEFDLNYDQEVERIREESLIAGPAGQIGGAAGGAPPMGGGMYLGMGGGGGAPPMDLGGGAGGAPTVPGGEAGGAAGGMGGAEMGGRSAPTGPATASSGLKITKRGKGTKKEEVAQGPVSKTLVLTSLERRTLNTLKTFSSQVPFKLYAQYSIKVPGGERPFLIDFAYPDIGVGIECLHPDQLVQTQYGSCFAKDIQVGDSLFGRNGDIVTVQEVYHTPHNGNMLSLKALGMLPLNVTETHSIYKMIPVEGVKFDGKRNRKTLLPGEIAKVHASELKKNDYLIFPKIKLEIDNNLDLSDYQGKGNNIPVNITKDSDFGWLMGIYAAEGSSKATMRRSVEFCFDKNEIDLISKTKNILETKFGLNSSITVGSDGSTSIIRVSSTSFARFCGESFGIGACNKRIPNFIFNSSEECKKAFILALKEGDGCTREDGMCRITSSSRALMSDTQLLLGSINIFGTISKSRNAGIMNILGRECNTNGLWEIDYRESGRRKTQVLQDDKFFYIPLKTITNSEFNGNVINFTISGEEESDHTYIAANLLNKNCDGAVWHEYAEHKERDIQRDQKLANVGWRILRFNEDAITDNIDEVKKVIYENIVEAAKDKSRNIKNAGNNEELIKLASNNFEGIDNLIREDISMPNGLGYITLIGT